MFLYLTLRSNNQALAQPRARNDEWTSDVSNVCSANAVVSSLGISEFTSCIHIHIHAYTRTAEICIDTKFRARGQQTAQKEVVLFARVRIGPRVESREFSICEQ